MRREELLRLLFRRHPFGHFLKVILFRHQFSTGLNAVLSYHAIVILTSQKRGLTFSIQSFQDEQALCLLTGIPFNLNFAHWHQSQFNLASRQSVSCQVLPEVQFCSLERFSSQFWQPSSHYQVKCSSLESFSSRFGIPVVTFKSVKSHLSHYLVEFCSWSDFQIELAFLQSVSCQVLPQVQIYSLQRFSSQFGIHVVSFLSSFASSQVLFDGVILKSILHLCSHY